MKSIISAILLLCLAAGAADFYVATDGSDGNPGTLEQPFATLAAARNAVRALSHPLSESATIHLRGGRYYLQSALTLSGSQDSGTPSSPVIWRNYGNEAAYVIGGVAVTNFVEVTDEAVLARLTTEAQANVLVADLSAQSITALGVMTNHGNSHHDYDENENPYQSELLFKDHSVQLARWPNETGNPRTNWIIIDASDTTNSFVYTEPDPKPWLEVTNAWVQGYWAYDYRDSWERVTSIDTNANKVGVNYPGAWGSQYNNPRAYDAGQRFFFFNILEELDAAGEYYMDFAGGKLYFWPPSAITNGACVLSITTNIVYASAVSNVAFSGLTFQGGKSALLRISGGQSNLVDHCTLRCGSADGIKFLSSFNSGVYRSSIYDMGQRGVWFYGSGNRTTLTSGSNFVSYCTLSNIGRICTSYKNAVEASHTYYLTNQEVIGVYIGHNVFHDMPHTAILLSGNDNVTEYNEFYRVCTETADAAAFYIGGDWSFRGNVVRYNYFHDINVGGGAINWDGVKGVYLDDGMSGVSVYGNIFCDVDHGVVINGGRDNVVQNNIFVNCTNYLSGRMAAFGAYMNQFILGRSDLWAQLSNRVVALPYQQAPWSTKYPALVTILTNSPYYALSNSISTNIFWNNLSHITWEDAANTNTLVANNVTNADPLFVSFSTNDCALCGAFQVQAESPALANGWVQIPFSQIGPGITPIARIPRTHIKQFRIR